MENKGGPGVTRLVVSFLRSFSGLTQAELAEASGLAQSDISRYELGRQVPSEETMRRLALAVGLGWPIVVQLHRFIAVLLAAADRPELQGEEAPPLGASILQPLLDLAAAAYFLDDEEEKVN